MPQSASLGWNIHLCVEYVPAKKTILISSPNQNLLCRRSWMNLHWSRFLRMYASTQLLVLSKQSNSSDPKVIRRSPWLSPALCQYFALYRKLYWLECHFRFLEKKFFSNSISSPLYIGQIRPHLDRSLFPFSQCEKHNFVENSYSMAKDWRFLRFCKTCKIVRTIFRVRFWRVFQYVLYPIFGTL